MSRRGRPPVKLVLDEKARTELRRRVRAFTSTQREARRARVILACEEHGSAKAAAKAAGVHHTFVERWRPRFLEDGLAGLEDRPRAGHKSKFGPVARMELIALACEPLIQPSCDAPNNGVTRRTIEDLVVAAVKRSIVDSISWSSYQRLLAEVDLRPHMVDQWVHSPDPQFREKVTAICELYLHPQPGSVVLSIDEKTGMQALARRFPDQPATPGRKRRREFEYKRYGTQTLLCAFEVHTGRVVAECGATRTAADLVRFMEKLAEAYPGVIVHVVWDNLNIHFDGADGRWTAFNARHGNRFVFHYTPKHASWVNQVECFFGIVERKCLADGSFHSTEELRQTVLAFIDHWNRDKAHPFRWTFTGYPLQTGVKLAEAAWLHESAEQRPSPTSRPSG